MVQNIILSLTLIVLFWYTLETYKLRKESEKQTDEIVKQKELSVRPFLRLLYFSEQETCHLGRKLLVLTNEGTGAAIDINITVKNRLSGPIKNSEVTFLKIPVIKQDDQCNIWDSYIQVEPMQSTWSKMHYISPKGDVFNEYELLITFQDILNNRHKAWFKTNNEYTDSFEIIEQRQIS